jgi:hypothetical protein
LAANPCLFPLLLLLVVAQSGTASRDEQLSAELCAQIDRSAKTNDPEEQIAELEASEGLVAKRYW